MTRGGKREGSGRKKKETKHFRKRVTPEEYEKLDEYLKQLRAG